MVQQTLVIDPESEAADEVGVGNDDALGASLGNVQLGFDGVRSPLDRGIIPRWMFCTSPMKLNVLTLGIGGRIPYRTDTPAISGSTRLRSASFHHRSWSSWTLLGCCAATFSACEKSSARLYSSQPTSRSGSQSACGPNCLSVAGDKSHGMRLGLEAAHQPSLYIARLPNISKYCVVWRSGVCVVEGVQEAGAVHRLLRDPVNRLRLREAGRLQDRRADVDDVRELRADGFVRLDPFRRGDGRRVARPPRWLATCCPTGTACSLHGPRPLRSAAQCGSRPSPSCHRTARSASVLLGVQHQAVEEGQLVERAGDRALHLAPLSPKM